MSTMANTKTVDTKRLLGIGILSLAVLIFAYLLIPKASGTYMITVVNGALIYYVANIGCALMLGQCGLVSFASVAFMGVGGYISALLALRLGVNPFFAMLLAAAISMLLAWLLGMVLMRLNGTFFTFSTIALVQISYTIFNGWKAVTGGPNGIPQIPAFRIFGWTAKTYFDNYYVLITLCLLAALLAARLKRTNLGRAMASVRDNELVAMSLGVDVFRTKVTAFAISAGFAGFAGAALVHSSHYVVSTYFTFDNATTYIIQVMVGGVYNIAGVFLGTMLITMLPEWLRPLQEYIRLVYGLGVIFIMIFMPMGIWGTMAALVKKAKKRLHIQDKLTPIGCGAAAGEGEN